ncbi:diacylglycerol O-acyltransferase 3-like isoform X1 [Malus sylvestris]|uniref:diacylglycerol O-acyltransferase 3-like isoform X1 n=1 Tax=Malus sylvestris TaxID=3752 RepID=UPI0021ABFC89|nr:diacylglycerol O-acyltransferase 3-like isoform X1 [Malus sylvestris]
MEASGVVSRQVQCFSAAKIDNSARSCTSSFNCKLLVLGRRDFGVSLRTRKPRRHLNSGFSEDGHLQYYQGGPMCGGMKEKAKEIKKKVKLLKGLSKNLAAYSQMGFGPLDSQEGLVDQLQGKLISESAEELLLKQLEQLRAEEKELKKRGKEEKARLKAERMKTMVDSESSSSSSSESSDSECGEVVDMKRLQSEVPAQPIVDSWQPFAHQEGALLTILSSLATHQENTTVENGIDFGSSQIDQKAECCNGTSTICGSSGSITFNESLSSAVVGVSAKKIEVCMGNKCKKSGGVALLEEFERQMGGEGAVVGCKCMGKCKNGPNVRVSTTVGRIQSEGMDDSVRSPTNPLYIGVGLEDVSLIVANLIGEENKDLDLVSAA